MVRVLTLLTLLSVASDAEAGRRFLHLLPAARPSAGYSYCPQPGTGSAADPYCAVRFRNGINPPLASCR
jgi:hypothetical protein